MGVKVLIVDDQEPFRMAARMVVEATEGFDVVGEAETGEDSVTMATDLSCPCDPRGGRPDLPSLGGSRSPGRRAAALPRAADDRPPIRARGTGVRRDPRSG